MQAENKWKRTASVIWFCVPLLAVLIMGVFIGSYYQGNAIEKALLNTNLTLCKDTEGNVWFRESKVNAVLPEGNFTLTMEPTKN